MSDKLKPYTFHGVELRVKGDEALGDCPFCGKDGHFSVSVDTGQFRCLVCGDTGNIHTFLNRIHAQALSTTSGAAYRELSGVRSSLPPAAFENAGLAWDHRRQQWLLPIRNGSEDSLLNLKVWDPEKGLLSTAGMQVTLYGLDTLQASGPIYICEGEWDAIALRHFLLQKMKWEDDSFSVLGVPGATTFKEAWRKYFTDRDVILLYDYDDAGHKGMLHAKKILHKVPKSVRALQWPAELASGDPRPKGYDLRDYVHDNWPKPKSAWETLMSWVEGSESAKPEKKLTRSTFASVAKDFRKNLHFSKRSEEVLAIIFAVVFSIRLPGDPLWVFLVGPPGSGKTLFITTFMEALDRCVFVSKLTSTALVSGFKTPDGEDPSLLGRLRDKCLLIKDYTAVMAMPAAIQEELYGILRDSYDGFVSVPYGNGQNREFKDLHYSFVAGVTDSIHAHNRAALGERFLKVELLEADYDPGDHIRAALEHSEDLAVNVPLLQASVSAFLEKELDPEKLPSVPKDIDARIVAMSQIASYVRAVVERNGPDLVCRPRPEIGTRLAKQLKKLAQCLAFVYDKPAVDEACYTIAERVGLDTMIGWNLEVLGHLFQADPVKGLTVPQLGELMQVSWSLIQKRLMDLQELSIIWSQTDETHKGPGRPTLYWRLTDKFRQLLVDARLAPFERKKPRRKPRKKHLEE